MALQFQSTGGVPTPVFFPHAPGAFRPSLLPASGTLPRFTPGPQPPHLAMAGAAHQMIAAHAQRQAAARAALASHPRFF